MLVKFIPEINAQLRKEGEEIEEVTKDEPEESDGEKLAIVEKTKKQPPKKANIEATSDEESD